MQPQRLLWLSSSLQAALSVCCGKCRFTAFGLMNLVQIREIALDTSYSLEKILSRYSEIFQRFIKNCSGANNSHFDAIPIFAVCLGLNPVPILLVFSVQIIFWRGWFRQEIFSDGPGCRYSCGATDDPCEHVTSFPDIDIDFGSNL